MINIYGYTIDPTRIIGVGPLRSKQSTDPVNQTLYHATSFSFDLLLTHYSFEISTNVLKFDRDHKKASEAEFEAFRDLHTQLRDDLRNLIPLSNNFGV